MSFSGKGLHNASSNFCDESASEQDVEYSISEDELLLSGSTHRSH